MKGLINTILLVDDSPVNLKILGEMLKSEYKIRIATNGRKALEIADSSQPPDLILLDVIMDDINGYEVCRRLKQNIKTQNIPIIFITSMDREKDEMKGLALGAVDYVTKPFSFPILKARIKTHLELKRHRDFLENLSNYDGLTGIPNRRRFDEVIREEWRRAQELSTPLSLLMLDIDFFKKFNDYLGHVAGDDCLKQVATGLKDAIRRPGDFIARYGGEEFCMILPDTNPGGAKQVGRNIQQILAHLGIRHPYSPISEYVTCSIGVAVITPRPEHTVISFIETADQRLYQAKKEGRNCMKMTEV